MDLNSIKDIELNSKDVVFEDSNIYVHYEEDAVTIPIVRRLGSNSNKIISSVCRTRPLTAISGLHFVPMRDNLTFGINESQKFIRLDLNQKDFENEEGTGIIFKCIVGITDTGMSAALSMGTNKTCVLNYAV